MQLQERGLRVLNALYELIFREKMNNQARKFIFSTSYVGIGTVIGAVFTMSFNVLGARILGPSNFGNLSLVTTVGIILSVSMGLSLTPMVKYASERRDRTERTSITSTAYVQIMLLTGVSTVVFLLFSTPLSRVFGVSEQLFFFALLLAVTYTLYQLTTHSLRIFFKMRAYAVLTAGQSVVLFAAFLTFISNDLRSWQAAAFSLYLSYVVISVILVVYLRGEIKLKFDRSWSKRITRYALLGLPASVAASLLGVDKILVNTFMTTADVGVYNAYFMPSITVAVMLWAIFNAAFFPYASRSDDKLAILRSVKRATPYLVALLVPSFLVLQWVAFFLYGQQYPFSWGIALCFAVAATIHFFWDSLTWLTMSEGARGARAISLINVAALIVLIGLDVLLIPLVGILGAVLTLLFTYLVAVLYIISKRHLLAGGGDQERHYSGSSEARVS